MAKRQNCLNMDTDSFDVYIKTDENILEEVETRFDAPNYELDEPGPKGENKKVIGLMKNELGGKTMTKFVGLRGKTYIHLKDDGSEDKKAKSTKKYVIKKMLKFENYGKYLEKKISYSYKKNI